METITVEVTDRIRVKVLKNELHDFLITNKEAGMALEISEHTVRDYKGKRYRSKLEEGVHHLDMKISTTGGLQTTNLLTKAGLIKFAELLGGKEAKRVELWAKQYTTKAEIEKVASNTEVQRITMGIMKVMLKYDFQQAARNEMLQWIEQLENLNIEKA